MRSQVEHEDDYIQQNVTIKHDFIKYGIAM